MNQFQNVLEQAWRTHQAGNPAAAESVYRQVLAQDPQNAAAYVYLGIALFDRRQFAESADAYRTALQLNPQFPVAWNNLGNSLRMLGEVEEADRCFDKALEQQPGYLSPLKNRGTLWIWAGEIDRGLASYQEALRIAPNDPELHRNLGVIYLLQQRYAEGFEEYRWRKHFFSDNRRHSCPAWTGEDPAGKTFLLYPEQGLGDAIQFIRVGSVLKEAGARTVLQCASNLIPLFGSCPGIDSIVPDGIPAEQLVAGPIDYHASLIDVVDYWYGRTGELAGTVDDPAPQNSAYLSVSDSLVDYWRRALDNVAAADAPDGRKKRVGLCWQGNPHHHADIYRSVPLEEFSPLAERDDIQLISLQHGFGAEQLDSSPLGRSIRRLPEGSDRSGGAFLDTAAVICNLDLVVTIDTSTAHLAGALGVPVRMILGRVPDWRWGPDGDTTPWYPTMKLFRQQQLGNWSDVIRQIAAEPI